jgi:enterochelin esterase-like enzyme
MKVLRQSIFSTHLNRLVIVEIYVPIDLNREDQLNLLLINDGQDLSKMNFFQTLKSLSGLKGLSQLICVGIHAGAERKQEYGVAGFPDYQQRGAKAQNYRDFILFELLAGIKKYILVNDFNEKYFLGFSLGGLMAFDIAMDFQHEFKAAGVFSGSFWWRSKELGKGYDDNEHRIIHKKVSSKIAYESQSFFFQTGKLDEVADRNKNGIIDSIDDTIDLIAALEKIGYRGGSQLAYLELEDGGHNIETWARVMPSFIQWLLSES